MQAAEAFNRLRLPHRCAASIKLHMGGAAKFAVGAAITFAFAALFTGCTKKKSANPAWAEAAEAQLASDQRPRNLVLVTIDTLRADAVGAYGSEWKTPNLDAFAKRAVVFDRAFSTAPFTGPSHASILTSRHPSKHGVVFNGHRVRGKASPDSVFVSEHLATHGYATGAVVSAPSPVSKRYGFARGFDRYHQSCKAAHGDVAADGACIVTQSRRWLAEQKPDQPFFLWVHLFDPHFPYIAPAHIYDELGLDADKLVVTQMSRLKKLDPKRARKAYLVDVYEGDQHFGDLMKALVDLGLMKTTAVVVTADHGEHLGEHGRYEHSGLYDEVLHVPLMIAAPGLHPERRPELVSTIDIVPTLLDTLELPAMSSAQGRSVAERGDRIEPVFAEWRHFRVVTNRAKAKQGDFQLGVRTDDHKLIVDWLFPDEGTMFFDLRTEPKEENNRFDLENSSVKTLSAILDAHIEHDLSLEHLQRSDIAIDPKTMKMLQALGYVE